jgi:hypothetical protein
MDTLLALAPYLLILLCPAAMFFAIRYMMKAMRGEQNRMNMVAPPHDETSNGGSTVEPVDARSSHA